MYSNKREVYRQIFINAWQKHQNKMPIELLESQLINIILKHPEYQSLLDQNGADQEFILEQNPFLHMSLHLSIEEQVRTNNPAGITQLYQRLIQIYKNPHEVQHKMMECLAAIIAQAQQERISPNKNQYLLQLKAL